jgi:hypothetical protein
MVKNGHIMPKMAARHGAKPIVPDRWSQCNSRDVDMVVAGTR